MLIDPLSDQGERRRQAILQLAHTTARKRRANRLAYRSFAMLFMAAVTTAIVVHLNPPVATIRSQPIAAMPIEPANTIAIVEVATDSTIADRLAIPPVIPHWSDVDNSQLLAELASAGRPAGVVTINGKTMLLPRSKW